MIVYKYLVPDRIDVLENGMIRFTQPDDFNDPFDILPCYTQFAARQLAQTMAKLQREQLEPPPEVLEWLQSASSHLIDKSRELLSREFAILCLSKRADSILMWSHYADCHRGFVIGFNADNEFFQRGRWNNRAGLEEVSYNAERYVVAAEGVTQLPQERLAEAAHEMFRTKSLDWAYEQELRIVAHPSKADRRIPFTPFDICLYEFPSQCVREVVCGFKSAREFRTRMREIAKQKYPHAAVYCALLDDTKYKMRRQLYDGEDPGRMAVEVVMAP